ncbi:MAG: 2-C-methyl-D-erythritol 4-phosphate cytidylyltransferase [Solirubrobacteraceae bacterium]
MAVALIVAAGRGERLGSDRPKALITLADRPMLEWSVLALRAVPAVLRIVIALPPGLLHAAPEGTVAVPGGAVRSESVLRALEAAGDGDPVIVHDAARPLAEPALFGAALQELQRSGADAVIAACPVTDTIKQTGDDDRTVSATLRREGLWAVQTPQVFRRAALDSALREASPERLARATDDAWLVEHRGGTVRIVPAPAENLKVTRPIDLRVAELLLAERAALTGSPS